MKLRVALLSFLLLSSIACAQQPSEFDYPVKIHVISSRLLLFVNNGATSLVQLLAVTIDGRKFELTSDSSEHRLLHPGDYSARVTKDDSEGSYENKKIYEIKFSNGKTKKYFVSGEFEQ